MYWSFILSGFTRRDIRYGIATLDTDWPPSAIQFANICRRRTVPINIQPAKQDREYKKYYSRMHTKKLKETEDQIILRKKAAKIRIQGLKTMLKTNDTKTSIQNPS